MHTASLYILVLGAAVGTQTVKAAGLKNVLMIAVDDLRTQMSVYPEGGRYMHTPNLERLANRTVVFERAYVQVSLCMPSRTSLLTSRRPDTSRSWTIENDEWFRLSGGNFTTLPQRFRQEGYLAIGMGKIFHETMPASDPQDYVLSWSPEAVFPDGGERSKGGLWDPDEKAVNGSAGYNAFQFPDELEGQMQDGNITDHAVQTIEGLASGEYGTDVASGKRPFFLAVGFHKPHIPWFCPRRFWDHYPIESVPPTPHPKLVTANTPVSLQDWQELGACDAKDMKSICEPLSKAYPLDNTSIPLAASQHSRQAYFACVSWTDSNIGRVLDAFDATPFAKDAVLAFWGDHGWHLGDNDIWEKMTNYEHGTKIPLMIGCAGGGCVGRSSALVEAIDLMPTLLEEAGIAVPTCPSSVAASRATGFCTEGRSLSRLLRNPAGTGNDGSCTGDESCTGGNGGDGVTFTAAYSQFPRPEHPSKVDLSCRDNPKTQHGCADGWCLDGCPNKMGYTVRTHLYRYTLWVGFNKCSNSSCPDKLMDWTTVYGEELYNHSDAPVPNSYDMETINIAGLASARATVADLKAQLITFNTPT